MIQAPDILKSKEKISTLIFKHPTDADKHVASEIANLIKQSQSEDAKKKHVVLGLATGSTPVGVYSQLVRMHKEEGLSFKNVITFNLDEYYPIQPDKLQSYYRFMHEHLFDHIDIPSENVHIPDGTLNQEDVNDYCEEYEKKIVKYGGIDVQILGIGRTGHIGFNEPGSSKKSQTRMIYLDRKTRFDAASDFFSSSAVPRCAITMGVGTILNAKRIILIAYAEHKAHIIKRAVEGEISNQVAASYLQEHPNSQIIVDMAAANQLTRVVCPWTLLGNDTHFKIEYDERTIRRAVIWLARTLKKPILKLTEDDYIDGHLQPLLNEKQLPVYRINISVFEHLKSTITGWPGGKPTHEFLKSSAKVKEMKEDAGATQGGITTRVQTDYVMTDYAHINNTTNPHIRSEFPKRVIVFSPHPDDDVISMGGTLIRLVEQGHKVHVVYQTSGDIAVWDEDVQRFANFASEFAEMFNLPNQKEVKELEEKVETFISNKKPGQVDDKMILSIKALIRKTEARSAARYCGVKPKNIHFLQLPFYETGKVKKNPIGEEDIKRVYDLLEEVKPHQIYAAGDLSDPHGTHRQCLIAIMEALKRVKDHDWFKNTSQVWLYRGAWQEWEPEDIQMAIPMSPQELLQKRYAIYKHQSQKDPAPFPGSDPREFWQRTECRNRATAKLYDELGLPEYEACEAFVLYDINKEGGNIPL